MASVKALTGTLNFAPKTDLVFEYVPELRIGDILFKEDAYNSDGLNLFGIVQVAEPVRVGVYEHDGETDKEITKSQVHIVVKNPYTDKITDAYYPDYVAFYILRNQPQRMAVKND